MLCGCSIVIVRPCVKVITIEPSADALSMGEVVKFLSMVFGQISALQVVDKFVLNNLRKSLRRLKRRPCGRSRRELPKDILSDHGSQFKEQWKKWRCERRVEVYFAHPSHPQDKGKVERCIQNLNGEFIDHPWEVSRMAQRQTKRVRGVVQSFTFS